MNAGGLSTDIWHSRTLIRVDERERKVAGQFIGLSDTLQIPDKGGEADMDGFGEVGGFACGRSTDADFAEWLDLSIICTPPTLSRVGILLGGVLVDVNSQADWLRHRGGTRHAKQMG